MAGYRFVLGCAPGHLQPGGSNEGQVEQRMVTPGRSASGPGPRTHSFSSASSERTAARLHNQEAVVVLSLDGHKPNDGEGAAHIRLREVTIQLAGASTLMLRILQSCRSRWLHLALAGITAGSDKDAGGREMAGWS